MKIDPKMISDTVVEAALRSGGFSHRADGIMRLAIAAALEAWPGMEIQEGVYCGKPYEDIILPLPPQEASDV